MTQELVQRESETEMQVTLPHHQKPSIANPLDISPAIFKKALDRRKKNRDLLIQWIRDSLVNGVDYMRVWSKKRKEWSKPFLTKAGSEKVLAMLGLQSKFPGIDEYQDKVMRGEEITLVAIACHLTDGNGNVVGIGAGARSVIDDQGDINKALKMALKSAQIDATLRTAGLSEIFSQDPESAADDDIELPVNPDQLKELMRTCDDLGVPQASVAEYYGVASLAALPAKQFFRAKKAIMKAGARKQQQEEESGHADA